MARDLQQDSLVPMSSQGVRVRLILLSGSRVGEECEVVERAVLGRNEDCDLRIDDQLASRRHARVSVTAGGVYLEDLGSSNGTRLHGERIRQARLDDGDEVQIGSTVLKVRIEPELRSPAPLPAEPEAAAPRAEPLAESPPAPDAGLAGLEEIQLDDLDLAGPSEPGPGLPPARTPPASRPAPARPAPRSAPSRPQAPTRPVLPANRPPLTTRPQGRRGLGGPLGDDLSQRSGVFQALAVLLALAAAAGLFWLAYHAVS